MNYKNINILEFETSCVDCDIDKWDELMKGHKRANKKEIEKLLKIHYNDMYIEFGFDIKCSYNPYNYYKTETHIILVHSAIEYFFKYSF